MSELVDVIEVEIAAPHRIRVMDIGKTPENAEAFINMAIARRGVAEHFFTTVPTRTYRTGDTLPQRQAA